MPNGKNGKKKQQQQPKRKQRKPQARRARTRRRSPGNYISTNPRSGRRAPQTRTAGNGTIVTHTETFGINITGSQAFSVNSMWALQPGIAEYSRGSPLGVWLPQIAGNFDNYEIMSLKFSYRAACSTLTPGLVAFGYEPNPESLQPQTFQDLRNMRSVDGSVHANLEFDISKQVRKQLLTRKGSVVNLPSYDAGKVFFASIGSVDGAQLGFVDVHYQVRLFNPQSSNTSPGTVFSYIPIAPVQRWSAAFPTNISHNAAATCFGAFGSLLEYSASVGTPMLEEKSVAASVSHTTEGYQFISQATNYNLLSCKVAGRYRVRVQWVTDFQDLQLFATAPFVSSSSTSSSFELAQEMYVADMETGVTATMPVEPYAWRGFSGIATGDPNPGTDLGFVAEWDIILAKGQLLTIGLGTRTYNSVSVGTTTTVFRPNLGKTVFHATYLGSLI